MKQILIMVLALALIAGCTKNEEFIVKGKIEDASGQKVFLYRMDINKDILLDSATIKRNGSFKIKQPRLNEPTFFKLSLTPNRFITLLADSAEHIDISSQNEKFASDYTVKNSVGSKHIQLLNKRVTSLRQHIDSLANLYNNLSESEKQTQAKVISDSYNKEIKNYKKNLTSFIMENPRSFASYYGLFLTLSNERMIMNVMDKQDQIYFATIATSLNLLYPESPRVKQLYNLVLEVKAQETNAKLIELINNSDGSGAPELKVNNINDQEIALSSLKGKVVLLSFSASWDKASLKENKILKSIYKKYSPKGFEIYQVSLERSKAVWHNYIIKNNIPWISVSDLMYTESTAARIYNIQKLPANYLISREGEIIGKNLFGSMLEEKLEEVL